MRKISTVRNSGISSVRKYSEWSLRSKLFVYMLFLALLLLLILTAGLVVFGRTTSTEDTFYEALDIQMEVFEKDVSAHFDHLAASAITLSEKMTDILEAYLHRKGVSLPSLNDSVEDAAAVQAAMIEPLQSKLFETDCSGAFVMLNATVNTALPDAAFSRTGLYLQINGYTPSDPDVLMYRGFTDIAKAHGIMPHRKWRLEFRTDLFPDYAEIRADAALPLERAYRITELFVLPGTSENVLLLTVPMLGADGSFYGICGYEISASYFMTYHAQPSKLAHLSCLLTAYHENILITSESLSCGGSNGYFHALTDDYAIIRRDGGLTDFQSDTYTYRGITKKLSLSADSGEYLIAVMVPRSDYDRAFLASTAQNVVLLVLLLFFTVSFCRYCSKRFLSPLLSALEEIKSDKRDKASSDIPEILDLIEYLDRQDKAHGETVNALTQKHQEAENEKIRLQAEYETALSEFNRIEAEYSSAQSELSRIQTELERLAYSRKTEIDPADYQYFLAGLETLTEAERNVFEYYLAGKTAKEILALTGVKESTLKYHNHNILGKLGVSSRKQMLRYAEIMRHQREETEN
ncbi:MAG: hypothetical protein E7662_02950 [Ruminococcaceae bacterium]|nr:hypothetical protein [Oscillospiraceae bacterium]